MEVNSLLRTDRLLALVPYVTLTEANANFSVQTINLQKGQQNSTDYLRLNPKHKVPLLLVDAKPLTENVAIQIWIAHNFPKAALLPSDPWQELRAISMLSWCASSIHPLLSRINSPPRVCDVPNTGDSVRRLAVGPLFENYQIAEEILAGRDYFFDHFTAVDAHFFWCFRRGLQFELDVSKFANCVKHHERMKSRSSVQKLLAHERTVQAEFAKAA